MRYPASEKLEIIRLVEQSHLPIKQTLDKLGIPRTSFIAGMTDTKLVGQRRWKMVLPHRHGSGTAFLMMFDSGSLTSLWMFRSCHHANWRYASLIQKSILSQRLPSIGYLNSMI